MLMKKFESQRMKISLYRLILKAHWPMRASIALTISLTEASMLGFFATRATQTISSQSTIRADMSTSTQTTTRFNAVVTSTASTAHSVDGKTMAGIEVHNQASVTMVFT
jgi:hypothetical protein